MQCHPETVELDFGTWLRLGCGHPAPPSTPSPTSNGRSVIVLAALLWHATANGHRLPRRALTAVGVIEVAKVAALGLLGAWATPTSAPNGAPSPTAAAASRP